MRGFFKSFFAAFLALIVFAVLGVFILGAVVGGLVSTKKPDIEAGSILSIDLAQPFREQMQENPLDALGSEEQYDVPGVYDIVRLIRHAKTDSAIKGIYIKCSDNNNGFATNEEIRTSILDFKKSGKFVYAYGDNITQKTYYVANVADRIYCNPKGNMDFRGLSVSMMYLKGALQKLDIEPQIFYAGKFKSATEPLREDHMTEANRQQLSELLNAFFNKVLYSTAAARKLDTAELRKIVNGHLINFPSDALAYKLVDGLKYDDGVKDELRNLLHVDKHTWVNFVPLGKYAKAVNYKRMGKDKISLIYAEGDIVDGKGGKDEIGGDNYRWLVRKARFDKDVKAIVIRVNSGGGSSLASENIWREIYLARKEKPVVVSIGDMAASGAYYFSCVADSIFCLPCSITGSIGVFIVVPNFQGFFNNKLGITFDGVKTAPESDGLGVNKPLTPTQRKRLQDGIDTTYHDFKSRVAAGRGKTIEYVDSIAQGRVWSGDAGIGLGLVDRTGTLQDAIDCAARMGKTSDYSLKEYPEPKSLLDQILGNYKKTMSMKAMKDELGTDGVKTFTTIKKVKALVGIQQARWPFDLSIE